MNIGYIDSIAIQWKTANERTMRGKPFLAWNAKTSVENLMKKRVQEVGCPKPWEFKLKVGTLRSGIFIALIHSTYCECLEKGTMIYEQCCYTFNIFTSNFYVIKGFTYRRLPCISDVGESAFGTFWLILRSYWVFRSCTAIFVSVWPREHPIQKLWTGLECFWKYTATQTCWTSILSSCDFALKWMSEDGVVLEKKHQTAYAAIARFHEK